MERITISYHPDSERQVLQIADALKGFGFDTWIIEKNSNEDTFKKLEEAMRETAVVIVCLTSKYERSQDCIVELAYAANLKKNPIPIYLEKCYRAGGEVAQIVANKRYIDFSDDAEFWENTKMLKIEIENRLKDEGMYLNHSLLYVCNWLSTFVYTAIAYLRLYRNCRSWGSSLYKYSGDFDLTREKK